ncbi:MAG: methyltransferase family protein [Streptosporangiaceae bacterium]
MVDIPVGRRLDVGRLVMVPASAVMLTLDGRVLIRAVASAGVGLAGALNWLDTLAIFVFYAIVAVSYLRRGPALATGNSVVAHAVAVLATMATFAFPLLQRTPPGVVPQFASDVLLVAGTVWAVWSLRYLGRNLSVIAQARGIADRGPYRLVRHPLYTGEIVSSLGLAIAAGTAGAYAVWLALIGMQIYRARQEEQILLVALPGYRDYRARTAALLPGIF